MIVSLLLLFLATAWIIYVYLDRYKYFVLPGSRVTPDGDQPMGSPEAKSAAPIKQRGILGASRPQTTIGKTPPATVAGVEPIATADTDAQVKSSSVDEPDKDQDDENGYVDQDSENSEDNSVDADDDYSDTDYPEQTDDEDSVYGGGNSDEEDEGDTESPLLDASNESEFDDDQDIYPAVTSNSGNLELTNRHSALHEFGQPTALKPSIVNQVKAIGLATTEDSSDQETLSPVVGFSDAFTDYDLDRVLGEEENQATHRVVSASPHYLYRDLPLSEYAAHFRALREAAQLIKREIDRAASKESVQHLARGFVRYIGEKGLSEDTNIIASTEAVLLGSDRTANPGGTGYNQVDSTSEYIDIFSRIEQAVATSQEFDAS